MPMDNNYPPLPSEEQAPPSEDFSAYCEAEFERRLNSGNEFDEVGYRRAKDMAMKKLLLLEEEGMA